jgi:hypothetical protein
LCSGLSNLTLLFVKNSQFKGEITYEMKDMAYCYRILEVPTDFFSLSADITRWLSEVESCKVYLFIVVFIFRGVLWILYNTFSNIHSLIG